MVYEFEEQFRNTDLMHSESDDGGSDSGFVQSKIYSNKKHFLRLVLIIGEEFENAANLDARRSRGDSFGNDNDIALDGYSDDGPNYSDEEE